MSVYNFAGSGCGFWYARGCYVVGTGAKGSDGRAAGEARGKGGAVAVAGGQDHHPDCLVRLLFCFVLFFGLKKRHDQFVIVMIDQ